MYSVVKLEEMVWLDYATSKWEHGHVHPEVRANQNFGLYGSPTLIFLSLLSNYVVWLHAPLLTTFALFWEIPLGGAEGRCTQE